ncbi:MAG: hypothetical protein BWY17_02293 [Deltaproteobacteria bacterium ADurb.Bin207]|nr:MAG: hypothetical protein BWY17_02293 [Deltaproteobacteria bacterium ADurb.Bin207]
MTQPRWLLLFSSMIGIAGFVGVLVACQASDAMDEEGSQMPPSYPGNEYPSLDGGGSGGGAMADAALPPEQELESEYGSPVATERYVWVANPVSGRVAYVDATTLEVRTVPAGNSPKAIAPVPNPDRDTAIVINELSGDATLLQADDAGNVSTTTFGIANEANSWAISPSGRWAIAWANADLYPNPNPVQGFQDISVIDVQTEKVSRLSIGYRPIAFSFSKGEERAHAVTQDGISVIDLLLPQGPSVSKLIPTSDDDFETSDTRDVSITPDGSLAFVRQNGSQDVTVVSLTDGHRIRVQLSGECTDLDLSADGTRAIAAIRDQHEIAILPVPQIATAPEDFEVVSIPNVTVGSVVIAAGAPVAFGFSNAAVEQRMAKIRWDVTPIRVQTMALHSPVLAVFLAENASSAIVVHKDKNSHARAFSALTLDPELPAKIVATQAEVFGVSLTPSGDRAVVAERNDASKIFGAYLVRRDNLQIDRYPLFSPPIAVGTVLGAKRAFVAQQHPEGRLTFIDLDTGLSRTLTGFELAARVIDGSQP